MPTWISFPETHSKQQTTCMSPIHGCSTLEPVWLSETTNMGERFLPTSELRGALLPSPLKVPLSPTEGISVHLSVCLPAHLWPWVS